MVSAAARTLMCDSVTPGRLEAAVATGDGWAFSRADGSVSAV